MDKKVLTARNEKVQEYIKPKDREYKKLRMEQIVESVQNAGYVFSKMFTKSKKQVLDSIIYLLSGGGICKVSVAFLMEKCGVSRGIVLSAVKDMLKTGEIVKGRLGDGHAGPYVFVDTAHPDYEWLMHDCFGVDVQTKNEPLFEPLFEPLENLETVEGVSVEDEKTASNCFNSFKKQALNNNKYINMADDEQNDDGDKDKKINEYGNKYQKAIYEFIKMMPFNKSIVHAAYEISLALNMDKLDDFILAKDTIKKVAMDVNSHLHISDSPRSLILGAYQNARKRIVSHLNTIRYNWLLNTKKPQESEYSGSHSHLVNTKWF